MTDQTTTPTVSEAQKPADDQRIAAEVVERYKELPISMSEHDQLTHLRGWIADAIGGSASAAEQFGRQAALRAMPEAQGWRPIESAPKKNWDRADLWFVYSDGYRETAKRYANSYWYLGGWRDSGGTLIEWEEKSEESGVVLNYCKVTHWMPLPAPPPQEVK